MRNEVVLDGVVLRIGTVRYSPAGVPQVQLRLGHESVQEEAGHPRRVRFQAEVFAVGERLAAAVSRLRAGQGIRVRGMLTRRSYRSEETNLVIHAHAIDRRDGGQDEENHRG